MEFRNETHKKLQDHLGKCKEVLATKAAADFAAFRGGSNKEETAYLEASASTSQSLLRGARAPQHICVFQRKSGRQSLHPQLVTLEMFILSIFPVYDSC